MVEINPMLASRSDGGDGGRPSGPLYPSPLTLTTLPSTSSSPATTKKAPEKQSPTKEKVKKVGGMLSFLMHGGHSSSSLSSSAVPPATNSVTGAGPKPENGGKYTHPADDPHRVKSASVDLENIYTNSKYDKM